MNGTSGRWTVAGAAAALATLVLSGCAEPRTSPAAATAPGPASAQSVAATCVSSRGSAHLVLRLVDTVDRGGSGATRALAQLVTAQRTLQAAASAATDDVLQERLQSLSDAVHAYVVAAGARDSSEYPDILAQVRGSLAGFSRTCLVDGGFETDTAGWSATGAGATLTRVSGGHGGSFAAQVTNAGSAPATVGITATGLQAKARSSYTVGAWVRSPGGSATVTLTLQATSGSTVLGTQRATAAVDATWRFVQAVQPAVRGGDTRLAVTATVAGVAPGAAVQLDDVSVSRH